MRSLHPWFLRLCALEGVIALVSLLRIPSEGGSLSPARLVLIGLLLFLILLFSIPGFRPSIEPGHFARPAILWMVAFLSLILGLILFLLRYLDPAGFLLPALYERLGPLLWYLFALSVQFVIYLLAARNGFQFESPAQNNNILSASLIAFGVLLLVLIFVTITKFGITKDQAYWGEPGVPILGWQFSLAILLGAFVLLIQVLSASPFTSPVLRVFLPLSVFLSAAFLWLNVPLDTLRNSFYAPITPPYNTPFPYSDAGFYDYLSQSLLIGTDYLGGIPPRPLYVVFLAFLHFLFGQDYVKVIAGQTLVFALFPVALYWLGSRLHSRAAGVTVAFFAIFRELTTLWIASNTRTASSRMFVTDFATALAIAFSCLVMIRWLERRDMRSTLIAGGSFGLLLLLRNQSLIVLPVLFVLAWFAYQKRFKEWFKAGLVFGVTMVLTVTPWLVHNYTVIGKVAFDDPAQMAVIYSQYSFNENLDISKFDINSESLGSRLISFTLENPGFVAGFILNHSLNTEIGGLLAMPLIEGFDGLRAPVNLYWITWDGTLEWYNLVLIVLYLVLIAIGIGAAWARWKWIAFVPLAFNTGYALANGISRFSSWRYNLPVDWVVYFYCGIGIVEVIAWISSVFGANSAKIFPSPREYPLDRSLRLSHASIVIAFVFVGSLPWLAKGLAQPRYITTPDKLKQEVVSYGKDLQSLDSFLSQPEAVIFEGEILYPRFFRRNDGIYSKTPWPIYKVRDFSRMGMMVLNDSAYSVILGSTRPLAIPQGSHAIVIGCQRDDYIEARYVVLPELDKTFDAEAGLNSCTP